MKTEIYTHQQYMADSHAEGIAAHRRFFGQFVTPATIERVVEFIGKDNLLNSIDRRFNDIPLAKWEKITSQLPGSAGFAKAGDYYTLSNGVCLAKEAARQWIDAQKVAT